MQKLVTIYLDNSGYKREKFMVGTYGDLHGHVEEHLQTHLSEGWQVKSIKALGGHSEGLHTRGWLAVVLEK